MASDACARRLPPSPSLAVPLILSCNNRIDRPSSFVAKKLEEDHTEMFLSGFPFRHE